MRSYVSSLPCYGDNAAATTIAQLPHRKMNLHSRPEWEEVLHSTDNTLIFDILHEYVSRETYNKTCYTFIIQISFAQNNKKIIPKNMKLEKIRIKNFRSYDSEIDVSLGDMTAFVGQNDAGKSSILEVLDIFFNGGKGVVKMGKADLNVKQGMRVVTK